MRSSLTITIAIALGTGILTTVAVAQPPAPAPKSEPAPRWPDGHVNLGSTPEHKGYWEVRPIGGINRGTRANEVPFQPWASAVAQYRQEALLHSPLVDCKPAAGPGFFNSPGFEFVEVPELKQIFILNIAGPHSWRVVYMDGREHPEGPEVRPTYLGHSVGQWDGDTLVIDTVGFNEKQWISGSNPTTTQLHMIERISRPTLGSLVYDVSFDDPGAYTGTWTRGWTINETTASSFVDGGEMFEYICQDAEAEGFGY